jgi:glutathione S-transferase
MSLQERVIGCLLDQVDTLKNGSKSTASSIKLSYFDGRGLAEVSRTMLAVAGVSFEDKRYALTIAEGDGPIYGRISKPEMDVDAAAGVFDSNMGRLPVLVADGHSIGGSKSIQRFIASQFGLNGSNAFEAAQIDAVCEHVGDIAQAFEKQEDKEAWFTSEETAQGKRALPYYLQALEKCLGNGFAVGSSFSMADAVIYNKFGENCKTKGLFGDADSQPFGDAAKTEAALTKYAPKLAAVVKNFSGDAKVQNYLANRGEQWF